MDDKILKEIKERRELMEQVQQSIINGDNEDQIL